jgi:hypothetical protein
LAHNTSKNNVFMDWEVDEADFEELSKRSKQDFYLIGRALAHDFLHGAIAVLVLDRINQWS